MPFFGFSSSFKSFQRWLINKNRKSAMRKYLWESTYTTKTLEAPVYDMDYFFVLQKNVDFSCLFWYKKCVAFFTKPHFFHFFWIFLLTMGCVVVGRELHQLTPKFKDKTENLRRRHRRHTHIQDSSNRWTFAALTIKF